MAGNNSIDIIINAITSGFNTNMNRLTSTVNSSVSGLEKLSRTVIGLGAAYAGITGLKSFAEDIIKTRMEYEKMEAALTATVGIENTDKVFKALQQFAKETPFTLDQAVSSFQRLVNLGIAPTEKMLRNFGNIVSTIKGKTLNDFAEAAADGMTGEYERLKEFGYKIKAIGKDGKFVQSTFQGVTKVVSTSSQAFIGYLEATSGAVANGKAMELQAATTAGRIAALGDTFDQLKNNIAKTSGASTLFSGTIEKLTTFVQNLSDSFEAGSVGSYVDEFKASMQPLIDMFESLKALAQDTPFARYFDGGTTSLNDFWEQLSGLYNQFMDFASYINQFAQNGGLTALWDEAKIAIQPLWDTMKEFGEWVKSEFFSFWEETVTNIGAIWELLPDYITKPVEEAYNNFVSIFRSDDGDLNGQSVMNAIVSNLSYFPAYINKIVQDALVWFKYFKDVAIGYISSVASFLKNASITAGAESLQKSLTDSSDNLNKSLKSNESAYKSTAETIKKAQDVVIAKSKQAQKQAESEANIRKIAMTQASVEAKNKLAILRQEQEANKKVDSIGAVSKGVIDKQKAGAKNDVIPSSSGSKKKGRSGSSSASKENAEYKKVLDGQIKLEEDRFKQGEVSAKEHFAKLLELKLAQLDKENTASSDAYKKNFEIINSSTSSEDQKKKAIEDNKKLQSEMNSSTEQEKNLRQEIANQLRDANKEFQKNMNDIQSALNDLQDNSTLDDKLNSFEEKYGEMRKRIKAEDEANGTNFLPKLDLLQSLTKATAEVAEQQRQLNELEAEYEARTAEIKASVADGSTSWIAGKREEISISKELAAERVKFLQNELNIANSTKGFSSLQTANIRKQLAEYQKAQTEINSTMKDLTSGIGSAFDTLFDSVIDGTKSFSDTLKDFLSDISKSVVNVLTKGWAEQLVGAFGFGGGGSNASTASSGAGAGGILSSIGSWIGGMFATGGVMKPNTYNVVGENGPELVYNGSRPTSVMNNGSYNKLNSGSGSTFINMNVTTKDANSMRQSRKQMMVEMQQEANRQINRNT